MNKVPVKSVLFLLLTATIWGVAFVAQQVGMDYIGPFAFSAIRSIMGSLVLIPVIYYVQKRKTVEEKETESRRTTLISGLVCGVVLFFAMNLQQFGIQYTTAGKAGFITALYIVIVPILGLFLGKKVELKVWVSVVVAVIGLYLLCMSGGLALSLGDALVVAGALMFSIHILCIDHFNLKVDAIKMSCIQFFVAGILSALVMVFVEPIPTVDLLRQAWLPLFYTGILSTGVAYTLQIVGQKAISPTVSSLILSLEAVIAVLAAWILLNQGMSSREIFGAALMFFAIIMAQIPSKPRRVLVAE